MARSAKDVAAALALVACTAAAFRLVPSDSWRAHYADPCHLAAIAGLAVVFGLLVTTIVGERALGFERVMLAVFLAGMPLVYGASWLLSPSVGVGWLVVEALAVPLYGALALLGLRSSVWWLVAGIAAHGLCWDAWHHVTTSVVPRWYATGCLVLDLAIAAYVAIRTKIHVRLASAS
jgi:hypothetical protein